MIGRCKEDDFMTHLLLIWMSLMQSQNDRYNT